MKHRRSERLSDLIAAEIRREGSISFERFMERALYEPGLGYYATADGEHGPGPDFRTSPQVGPVFARLMAVQLEECRRRLGAETGLTIVEYGAGRLELARGIISSFVERGEWREASQYLCVDPYAPRTDSHLPGGSGSPPERSPAISPAHVPEAVALDSIKSGAAVVLCNEFLDALPVRRFVMRRGRLHEIRIAVGGGGEAEEQPTTFVEIEHPLRNQEAAPVLDGIPPLTDGFQFELNARARRWLERVGAAIRSGYVITIDYGYRKSERFRPERAAGTLVACRRHRVEEDLYANVGDQDLTSHIDFDDLIQAGAGVGLACVGITDQLRFLAALAKQEGFLESEPTSVSAWKERLAFKELIRAGGMGTTFRVLIQATSTDLGPLCGLEDPFRSPG